MPEDQLPADFPGERVYGVLHKPVNDETLHATLELALERHRRERARERAMAELDHRYHLLLESAPDAMVFCDEQGIMRMVNQQTLRMFGYAREELIGQRVEILMPEKMRHAHTHLRHQYGENPVPMPMGEGMDRYGRRKDGGEFPIEINLSPICSGDGLLVAAAIRDVSQHHALKAELRASRRRFQLMYDNNPLMLFTVDARGTLLSVNDYGARQLGYGPEELCGRNISSLVPATDAEACMEFLRDCFQQDNGAPHSITLAKRRKDGQLIRVRETARLLPSEGERPELLLVCEDITRSFHLSRKLAYQASHDDLTGLINRREFEQRLKRVLQPQRLAQTQHAVAYLDLDQFKIVNDTCGHLAGDELLRQITRVLKRGLRRLDSLARLGGDEFAILLEDCDLAQATRVLENLRRRISDYRFVWEGKTFRIGVSIGLVPITSDSDGPMTLLRHADTACYMAKEQGRDRIHSFHQEDKGLARRHGEMQWVNRIHEALEQDRFELHVQHIHPLFSREPGAGLHYELLLRLRQDDGLIPPGSFLGAAERYGITPKIDRWVIRHYFGLLDRHPEHRERLGHCAINLSGHSLNDELFLDFVEEQFSRHQVPPERICFEITETATVGNLDRAVAFIQRLKGLGCAFALDDFGSGLSSFGYLKNLPVDYLKIDGQFIRDLCRDPVDRAMVKSINEVGHVMGMQTIAEFVEDDATREVLSGIGVDYAQGYGLHRPESLRGLIAQAVREEKA